MYFLPRAELVSNGSEFEFSLPNGRRGNPLGGLGETGGRMTG